jgi:hypothetical protein
MKKLIALLMVCGFAFAFVACGGGAKEEASDADTTAVAPAVEADTTSADTTATDTTAAQ